MPEGRSDQQAVLFDLDGVLVQTEPLKAQAHAAAIRKLGGQADPSLYAQHMGKSHQEVRAAFLESSCIRADPDEYSRLYYSSYRSLLRSQLVLAPGARELVEQLRRKGYLVGVVTSSDSWAADYILRETALARFLAVQVSADEVTRHKPAPDAYRLALRRLGLPKELAVAIEDSESGVEAASRAGLPVIAVRHPWNRAHDLAGAAAEFDSLRDSARIVSAIESILAPVRT